MSEIEQKDNSLQEKKITKQVYYAYDLEYGTRLDLMKKAVAVFATLERLKYGEVKIRKKLEDVLAFYALNGYQTSTKKMIIETLCISSENLTQINAELTKSGYLIRDANNFRKKTLHPDIIRLQKDLTDPNIRNKKAIVINFGA